MDLPSCPSCGQSVLDDDATDCPFCGAAMDGSSAGKKQKTPAKAAEKKKPEQQESKKETPADDDPFAIRQNPSAAKAVQCARKPMKGRRQRVVCPMCDTPGYIPKKALDRPVKCANKECMVPVFTAVDPDADAADPAPGRLSDQEAPAPKSAPAAGKARNPILMYGIVGGVLLLLTAGLVVYLNQEGINELGPAEITMPDVSEDEPDVNDGSEDTEPKTDHRKASLELIAAMIDAARANDNLDKPTSRRLIADCYLRLQMPDKAQAEFDQMNVVAARSRQHVEYYPIVPHVSAYWRHLDAADDAAANDALSNAKALAEEIPVASGYSIEATVALAAAMANSGSVDEATELIARQQRDQTVVTQKDAVSFGAWRAVTAALRAAGERSLPVIEVFAWNEPLMTAAVVELSTHGRWEAATTWAAASDQTETVSDSLAAVAAQMIRADAPAVARTALAEAASAAGPHVALRVQSVLARDEDADDLWGRARSTFESVATGQQRQLGTIVQVLQAKRPQLDSTFRTATGLADFVAAAAARNEDAATSAGFDKLAAVMLAALPSSAEIRRKAAEIDSDSSTVKAKVAEVLALNDPSAISTRFIAYRKAIDHMLFAAEDRRLHLLRLLCRIVQNGGLDAVQQELKDSESLIAQEVGVDDLKDLLFVAAAETQQDFSAVLEMDSVPQVPLERISRSDRLMEYDVVPSLVAAMKQYKSDGLGSLNSLRRQAKLPGLRAALVTRTVEAVASKTDSVTSFLNEVLAIQQDLWRNQSFSLATHILADRGMTKTLRNALEKVTLSPSQRVTLMYACALPAIDAALESAGESEGDASDAAAE